MTEQVLPAKIHILRTTGAAIAATILGLGRFVYLTDEVAYVCGDGTSVGANLPRLGGTKRGFIPIPLSQILDPTTFAFLQVGTTVAVDDGVIGTDGFTYLSFSSVKRHGPPPDLPPYLPVSVTNLFDFMFQLPYDYVDGGLVELHFVGRVNSGGGAVMFVDCTYDDTMSSYYGAGLTSTIFATVGGNSINYSAVHEIKAVSVDQEYFKKGDSFLVCCKFLSDDTGGTDPMKIAFITNIWVEYERNSHIAL